MVTTAELPETETPEHIPSGVIRNRFRISGDTVRKAIEDLPKDEQSTVWWFAQWVAKNIHIKADLANVLRKESGGFYSDDSIIQLLTGGRMRRGENIQPLLNAIEKLRTVEDLRAGQLNSGFIETRLFQEISKRCQKALKRQRILPIYGDSQIGKTESLKEYQRRNNHGQTIYIEAPCGGSLGGLLKQFADVFNIPSVLNQGMLQDRVIGCIDGNMLVIIDEFHNTLKGRSLAAAAFVRELWNRTHCGCVLSMTNEGRDILLKGPHAKQLQQLWRRRITPLQLPAMPPEDDLALFAQAYGLPPADAEPVSIAVTALDDKGKPRRITHTENPLAMQNRVIKAEGLGVWISILQDAADMAQEQRKAITWGAVIKAECQANAEADIFV